MKKQIYEAPKMPSANIAVNKSRIKLYNNTGDIPTYYLQSGTEFSIELFNPTTDVPPAVFFGNCCWTCINGLFKTVFGDAPKKS